MESLSLFIAILIIFVIYKIYRFHTYWHRIGVKGPNLWTSLMSYTKVLTQNDYQWYRKYGEIIGFYEIFKRGLIINDTKLIRQVLVKDFDVFTNRRYYSGGKIFDSGLFLGRDDQWRRVRGVVGQAFTPLRLRAMFRQMCKLSDQFCQNISNFSNKDTFDIKIYINAFVNDVICSCNYGIQINSIENQNHPIVANSRKFFEPDLGITNILGYLLPPGVAKFLHFKVVDGKAVEFFKQVVTKLINNRKSSTNKLIDKPKDLLQFLIDANHSPTEDKSTQIKTRKHLSSDETFATSMDFFIAGYGTTVCTLSHVCYYLAKHEEYQRILFEELSQIEELTEECLSDCQYLNAVIKETLRISPVSGRYDREAAQDCRLGDTDGHRVLVPKGCLVTISPFTVHHNPEYYPQPDEFRPQRFLTKDSSLLCDYTYLSWGLGPRMCVGMNFALNEIRIFVYKLIIRYRLTLPFDYQLIYPKGNLINMPNSVMVKVEERQQLCA